MLLVYGVVLITAAALLTAGAGVIYQRATRWRQFRSAVGGTVYGVILAATTGIGAVMLLAFFIEFETQSDVPLQVILAVVVAAVGFGGIWLLSRRVPAADSVTTAGPHNHPA